MEKGSLREKKESPPQSENKIRKMPDHGEGRGRQSFRANWLHKREVISPS